MQAVFSAKHLVRELGVVPDVQAGRYGHRGNH